VIQRKAQENLRAEAAAWVARLKDAHTAADRESFEQWLAKDPSHQSAYDRATASYEASGVLRTSKAGRRRDLDSVFPRRRKLGFSGRLAVASIAGLLLVGAFELSDGLAIFHRPALETVMLLTAAEAQDVTLADGSRVSMGPASEVRIDLNRTTRIAEIRKGRVRIAIARERRPFRIVAGKHSTEASAGTFEARIVGGEATLSSAAAAPTGTKPSSSPSMSQPAGTAAPPQTLEFNAEPLGQAVQQINQLGAGPRIELDPKLTSLRLTGFFRQGNSEAIARAVALAFDLKLVVTRSGTLRLTK
jgi:transmembrane sensor